MCSAWGCSDLDIPVGGEQLRLSRAHPESHILKNAPSQCGAISRAEGSCGLHGGIYNRLGEEGSGAGGGVGAEGYC